MSKGEGMKMIGIALAEGVKLKEHKTNLNSKLLVLEGTVKYEESNRSFTLHHFDEIEIPVNELHSLSATEDSLCLLIQKK